MYVCVNKAVLVYFCKGNYWLVCAYTWGFEQETWGTGTAAWASKKTMFVAICMDVHDTVTVNFNFWFVSYIWAVATTNNIITYNYVLYT